MNIFIGHDSRQIENSRACYNSLKRFGITPRFITLEEAKIHGYSRELEDGSTEFTYTRFLVPTLTGYKGVALFCDSDFIWLKDPRRLIQYFLPDYPIACVKHDLEYVRSSKKFKDNKNEPYPRKWWSSLMLFDCAHPSNAILTPEYVSTASAKELHRMEWTNDRICALPPIYNHLVGYHTNDLKDIAALHFTDGTPMHKEYENEHYADKWNECRRI